MSIKKTSKLTTNFKKRHREDSDEATVKHWKVESS